MNEVNSINHKTLVKRAKLGIFAVVGVALMAACGGNTLDNNVVTPAPSPSTNGCDATNTTLFQTEGPYYTTNTPLKSDFSRESGVGGIPAVFSGTVHDENCNPLAGAKIDFWHADAQGNYDNSTYLNRGHQFTDEAGRYSLTSIVPGEYPGRTVHMHVKIFDPSGVELLTTQIYFPGFSSGADDFLYDAELLAVDEGDVEGNKRFNFNFYTSN